ncbi:hypothetical protein ACFQV2_31520 [Actinokineospora soli]|uniref:HEAT repeat-containing protein n=1 Tax=Actinokineospora soli TaxID=1048753 RepID=A0ABW2TUX3_9PSEU
MLEGLDQVDWARLPHAYGPADDVPGQIRALRSSEASQRTDALWQLYGNIFHQGTRYEATAYAVPFLLEVLAAPDTADRAGLLDLLANIAVGYDETWLPAGLPITEHRQAAIGGDALLAMTPRPGDDGYDEDEGDFQYLESLSGEDQNRLFAHVAVTAYDAVRVGVPLFRTLLTDLDPVVRTRAAYALAWFPEEASGSLSALDAATSGNLADSGNEVAAATAMVATGLLRGRPPAAALNDPRPLVRWGAAIALANVDGTAASQAVVDELLAWTGAPTAATTTCPSSAATSRDTPDSHSARWVSGTSTPRSTRYWPASLRCQACQRCPSSGRRSAWLSPQAPCLLAPPTRPSTPGNAASSTYWYSYQTSGGSMT